MRLLILVLVLAGFVYGDVTGRISGSVKDPSGSAVANAAIQVVNLETGNKQSTRSDGQGFYSFPALSVGHYDLSVTQPGFSEFRETNLNIDVNISLSVNIRLQLGKQTVQITIDASPVQVDTASTQMGEVISNTKMEAVPLNGRSYTDLLALQPGVVPVSSGQYAALPVSGDLNPGSLSVAGQRESANGFMVNGANVKEGTFMGTAIIPNLDSIAEFRILTNNFDAEYGNYAGGQVNAVTKSGTNQFHGDVFEFLRNADLDARNFFSPDRGTFNQNQYGGTIGGPILKDKLFFFSDYQGTKQIVGQSSGNIPVPSAADRSGNLSDISSQLTGTVQGQYWANQLSPELGYPVTAGESYYFPGCSSSAACVFPNAVIPSRAITPIAGNLLKYIPLPNSDGYFSTSSANQTLDDSKGSIRIDSATRFGMISGYYFIDDFNLSNPYGFASFPGFSTLTNGRSQMFNAADTKTLGPSAVNEFRVNYTRFTYDQNKPSGGVGPTLSSFGFETGANTLGIVPLNTAIEGVPSISFNSYNIGTNPYTQAQYNNTYQMLDNFSKVSGGHTFKAGFNAHYDQVTEHDAGANNGYFTFNGEETGSDFADFLLGAPASYDQGLQEPLHSRAKYVGIYGQDSWHVASNLTLNYGLRWELTSPWYEAQGQLETIIPGEQSQVFPGSPTGWVFPGDPSVPKTLAPTRKDNFAPRIGLAYSPNPTSGFWKAITGGPGRTSIRAGFGMFYTALEDASSFVEVGDAPFGSFWASPTPPEFATPFVDRGTGNVEGQRFPVSFPPPNVTASNPDNNINWSVYLPISGSPAFYYRNRVPYAEDFNLSLQRQIGTSSLLSVAYVGTEGHALLSSVEANPSNPALCLSVSQPSEVMPNSATCGPYAENGVFVTTNGTVINGSRLLGNNFGSNQYFITIGNSIYNSLQATYKVRTGPVEVLAGYTFSKSLDDASGYEDQINPLNYKLSRGLSSFDVTHNFVVSYEYELPFAKVLPANRYSKGWMLTGITRLSTGLPITLSETDDHSLLGATSAGPVDTPNYTPGNLDITNPRSGLAYFNISLFSQEAIGQLGTADRRFFHGPGIANYDMALLKDLAIHEDMKVELRFEFFNIFNHAQFNNPSGDINNAAFGYVTSAAAPRIGQVALKFLF